MSVRLSRCGVPSSQTIAPDTTAHSHARASGAGIIAGYWTTRTVILTPSIVPFRRTEKESGLHFFGRQTLGSAGRHYAAFAACAARCWNRISIPAEPRTRPAPFSSTWKSRCRKKYIREVYWRQVRYFTMSTHSFARDGWTSIADSSGFLFVMRAIT